MCVKTDKLFLNNIRACVWSFNLQNIRWHKYYFFQIGIAAITIIATKSKTIMNQIPRKNVAAINNYWDILKVF